MTEFLYPQPFCFLASDLTKCTHCTLANQLLNQAALLFLAQVKASHLDRFYLKKTCVRIEKILQIIDLVLNFADTSLISNFHDVQLALVADTEINRIFYKRNTFYKNTVTEFDIQLHFKKWCL